MGYHPNGSNYFVEDAAGEKAKIKSDYNVYSRILKVVYDKWRLRNEVLIILHDLDVKYKHIRQISDPPSN